MARDLVFSSAVEDSIADLMDMVVKSKEVSDVETLGTACVAKERKFTIRLRSFKDKKRAKARFSNLSR